MAGEVYGLLADGFKIISSLQRVGKFRDFFSLQVKRKENVAQFLRKIYTIFFRRLHSAPANL